MVEKRQFQDLPSKKQYYRGLLFGWILLAVFVATFVALIRFWDELSTASTIALTLILMMLVPSSGNIGSLFRGYEAHVRRLSDAVDPAEEDSAVGEEVEVLEAFELKNGELTGSVEMNVGLWQAQLDRMDDNPPAKGELLVVTRRDGNLLTVRRRNSD